MYIIHFSLKQKTVVKAYITNQGSPTGTVSVLDTATGAFKTGAGYPISITSTGLSGVAVTPDGTKAYVANNTGSSLGKVDIIDTSTDTLSTSVNVGNDPIGITITPDGTKAYVANNADNTVSIIDILSNAVSATISILGTPAASPFGIAATPDGSKVYVTNNGAGTVSVINTGNNTIMATVTVGSGPKGVAVTPNGTKAYVANGGANTVSVIDVATNTVSTTVTVGNAPYGIAITPDGTKAYVANSGVATVSVINTSNDTVSATLNVGNNPVGIAITPDGITAYAANFTDKSVSPITVATDAVGTPISNGILVPVVFGQFIQPSPSIPMTSIYTAPQGRLTLTSNTPVMTSDATAQTSIYYAPYQGNIVPIYDGANIQSYTFGQLTMALNTSNQTSGNIYDLFVFLNSGVVNIGAGPAWSSTTARGTGAGTTQLQQTDGLWVNANSITLKNGSTSYSSIGVGQATYVGSAYMTANGQTGMQFKPAAASGGSNNILGLYNAYNRVVVSSLERDSAASWTYATTTWQPLNGASSNVNNRISWLDGLQQSPVTAMIFTYLNAAGAAQLGINLDTTTGTPVLTPSLGASSGPLGTTISGTEIFPPQLGFHYLQAMQWSSGTTTYYAGAAYQGLTALLET